MTRSDDARRPSRGATTRRPIRHLHRSEAMKTLSPTTISPATISPNGISPNGISPSGISASRISRALVLSLALLLPGVLGAATIGVPGEYATIQEAIDAADRFDEVVVEPGTYFEHDLSLRGKEITVRSTDAADPVVVAATIVDAERLGSVLRFDNGEGRSSVVSGLTLTGGKAAEGGGVSIGQASPLLDRVVIEGNLASKGGAGVLCRGDADQESAPAPLLRGVTIRDNIAKGPTGGELVGDPDGITEGLRRLLAARPGSETGAPEAIVRSTGGGLKAVDCAPILQDSLVIGNEAGQGGGAGFLRSAAVIRGTIFEANDAVWGGGVHLRESPAALVSESFFLGNTAEFGGGGLGVELSSLTIERTEIADNTAVGLGGGMVVSRSAPTLVNLLLHGNVSDGDGGGLAVLNLAQPEVLHSTFADNTARRGGALMVVQEAVATVTNSILWGDAPDEILEVNATTVVTYSDVAGGWPGDGNLDADPLFADPGNDDYHLLAGSPAADVALAEAAAADDLDGDVRPGGAEFDMGSDEFFGPPQIVDVPGDFATIQEAIDAAFNGDEVVLEPGTYVEHSIDFRGKAVTVRSQDPADPSVVASTIVDGGGGGSVFLLTGGETAASVLSGLTITGGSAFDGGGVLLRDSSATIDRSVVTGNSATFGNGGGIFSENGSMVVVGSTISGNSAADCADPERLCGSGGGIWSEGGSPRIEDSTLADNTAEFEGGGLYQTAGTLRGVTFTGNAADLGGGVRLVGAKAEGLVVGPGNTALSDGGGAYVSDGSLVTSTVTGNTAVRGGGLVLLDSVVKGSTIGGNHATDDGGGVWSGEIFDCVVEDNTSDRDGGGASRVSLVDESVVRRNVAAARGGGLANPQVVRESEVLENQGDQGGGLFVKNALADEAVVRETIVSGNSARLGGGLALETPWPLPGWNDPVPVRIADVEVVFNSAVEGGGIHCNECVGRLLTSRVADNTATLRGGGVYASAAVSVDAAPRLEIDATTLRSNISQETAGGVGCGLRASVSMTNSFVFLNEALDGGGFYSDSCELEVINSTVTQNVATGQGGGLATTSSVDPDIVPRVVNSILWNDTPDEIVVISRGLPGVSWSDVQGGWEGTNNLDVDPLFVDPVSADFHLTTISPLIDAARAADAPAEDFEGDVRPVGLADDIGADELFLAVEADRIPALTSVSPTSGLLLGGETVTVTGERFGTYSQVFFGAAEGEVVGVSETSLEVLTPAVALPGRVDVTVRNFGSSDYEDTLVEGYEFLLPAPPVVTTLDPANGSILGGDTVTITGSGFYAPTDIFFGLKKGTNVQIVDVTQLTVETPAGDEIGPVDVVVEDPWGQTGVELGGFTYEAPTAPRLDSVVPSSGTVAGGTSVQLLGDFLDDVVEVTFGGAPATQVVVVSPQEVTAVTPSAAAPGAVDVVVRDSYAQEDLLAGGFEYLAESDLAIFELVPPTGSTAGGEVVTVLGQGFTNPMQLFVDGVAAAVTFVDPGTLEFVTPPHAAGPACSESVVEVEVLRGDGASAATAFTYTPVQVIEIEAGEAIQPAIDAAAQNACILLAANPFPGYVENLDFGSKAVSMYGADPSTPEQTVINGSGGSGRVVTFGASASTSRLLSSVALVFGDGGVEVFDSSPTLEDVAIQDNETSGDGGGVEVSGDSRPVLRRVFVTGNEAGDDGGGVAVQNGSAIELEDSVVSLNVADDGGGVWVGSDAELAVIGSVIEVNEAAFSGGGVWLGERTLAGLADSEGPDEPGPAVRRRLRCRGRVGRGARRHAGRGQRRDAQRRRPAAASGGGRGDRRRLDLRQRGRHERGRPGHRPGQRRRPVDERLRRSAAGRRHGGEQRRSVAGLRGRRSVARQRRYRPGHEQPHRRQPGPGRCRRRRAGGFRGDLRAQRDRLQRGGSERPAAGPGPAAGRGAAATGVLRAGPLPGGAVGLALQQHRVGQHRQRRRDGERRHPPGGVVPLPRGGQQPDGRQRGVRAVLQPGNAPGPAGLQPLLGQQCRRTRRTACRGRTQSSRIRSWWLRWCPDPDLTLQPGSPAIDAGDPTFPVPPGGGAVVDIGANELGG